MSRALLLAALLALVSGCSAFWAPPDEVDISSGAPADSKESEAQLRDEIVQHPEDLGVRFALARQQEQKGLTEAASLNYGVVANGLPAHRFTRAWLCFARCELALDRDRSGERALEEVLAVVPDDESWYELNPDYRDAALLLAPLLAREGRTAELEKLHDRFLDQLGGEPEDWPVR